MGNLPVDLSSLSVRDMLRLYSAILTELVARGVVRTRNPPLGDVAEYLVARAKNGELAPNSAKSWDVLAGGRRIQVKARLTMPGNSRNQMFSPFRSWDFDTCVFVVMNGLTYDVQRAVEVAAGDIERLAYESKWVRGFRVGTKTDFSQVGIEVTAPLQRALEELG